MHCYHTLEGPGIHFYTYFEKQREAFEFNIQDSISIDTHQVNA